MTVKNLVQIVVPNAKQQILKLIDYYQNESYIEAPVKSSIKNSKKIQDYFHELQNQEQASFSQNELSTQQDHFTELEVYLAELANKNNDDPVLY
ncbi:4599_t:CDS:2 [Dentiscutata erythropus]|uniref:4599_t:CDS:1 n=1 Tax=Dentiscutata erythropus TaxID=1348616 RepID=A0A9N9I7I5_9GLOM|nr:4599_t:CDS:2 [Dentiscutata erythropus]